MSVIEQAADLVKAGLTASKNETRRLEKALDALTGEKKRGPGRPPGSGSTAKSSGPVKKRKRRGGTRRDQALGLIADQPGISASDIAKEMKIKPNYLYRVLGELEKEGLVTKDGRTYAPAK
jgi:CRP-like cAMP-binding protein